MRRANAAKPTSTPAVTVPSTATAARTPALVGSSSIWKQIGQASSAFPAAIQTANVVRVLDHIHEHQNQRPDDVDEGPVQRQRPHSSAAETLRNARDACEGP